MDSEAHDIPYFEYRAINELIHAHINPAQFGERLRAVVAFGDIKIRGGTYDIALLEVVDDLGEAYAREYGSTETLPLRGKLFLYFLPTVEFEKAIQSPKQSPARDLLEDVLAGYEIIYEIPAGYAREQLQQARRAFPDLHAEPGSDPFKPLSLSGKR